jgi:hypothetical protein
VFGVLVATTAAVALSGAVFMSTEVGQLALVDQWERTALAFGRPVDDTRYSELQALSHRGAEYAVGAALVGGPLLTLGIAAALTLTFNRAGTRRPFQQVLAITAYAGVILALRQIVAAPIGYLRETTASATTLGVWFPMLDEANPVARFLGLLDGFILWWAVVLAIGVSVLYQRRARALALTFVGTYIGLAALLTLVMAAVGGNA